jgi:tetratricopeptide (TPR) repeat protein
LKILPPAEAARLFVRLADRNGLQPSDADVAEVVRLCGYLPLAISLVAGDFKYDTEWTAADLVEELTSTMVGLDSFAGETLSLDAVFDRSYRKLRGDEQRLFPLLGLHPGIVIDPYAAANLDDSDVRTASRALRKLFKCNLIEEQAKNRFRFHDLLRVFAREKSDQIPSAERDAAIDRLSNYYLRTSRTAGGYLARHAPPPFDPAEVAEALTPPIVDRASAIGWLDAERDNLRAVTEYAAGHARAEIAVGVPAAIAGYLRVRNHWDQALTLHPIALAAARAAGDRRGEATALNDLGGVQQATGQLPQARKQHTRALEMFRELADEQGEADVLVDLAIVQRLAAEYDAVAAGLGRAGELYRRLGVTLGEANVLHDLGVLCQRTEQYPQAVTLLRDALTLYREVPDPRGESNALNSLGRVQQLTGQYPEAIASLTDALELYRGQGHVHGEAEARKNLGILHRLDGSYATAAQYFDDARASFHKQGDQSCEAETLYHIGELQAQASASADALNSYQAALELARSIHAPQQEANALEAIGSIHARENRPRQAATALREALEIYQDLESADAQRVRSLLREHNL